MTHIYSHRWTASFGETAINESGELTDIAKTWASGLAGISGEKIAAGLRACCDDTTGEWPTLPWFKSKCLSSGKNEFGLDYIPEYYRQRPPELDRSKLLSSDERDKKRKDAADQLLKLKAALKGEATE